MDTYSPTSGVGLASFMRSVNNNPGSAQACAAPAAAMSSGDHGFAVTDTPAGQTAAGALGRGELV
ncbi:MAG TPA: hypothetical protein VN327_04365 [Pseudonocardiaceae bacterium]|nr:hypothetical protein [Pseudonocardiaceae bacterium]